MVNGEPSIADPPSDGETSVVTEKSWSPPVHHEDKLSRPSSTTS